MPAGPDSFRLHSALEADASVAFIDFEASGLGPGSWPIEVGWGRFGGDAASLLIAPAADWPMEAWDPNAERLHGLTVATLRARGASAETACAQLNEALAGLDVFSDAPDYDGRWLETLYRAAGVRPSFQICDIRDLILPIAPLDLIPEIMSQAEALQPHTHRAAQDVRNLQTIYSLCRAACAQ